MQSSALWGESGEDVSHGRRGCHDVMGVIGVIGCHRCHRCHGRQSCFMGILLHGHTRVLHVSRLFRARFALYLKGELG